PGRCSSTCNWRSEGLLAAGRPAASGCSLLLVARRGPQPLVVALGLFQTNQAIPIGVDGSELLVGADELAPRHVAVTVAIHLAEPKRAGRRRRRLRTPAPTESLRHHDHAIP